MSSKLFRFYTCLCAVATASPALSEEKSSYPSFSGEAVFEVQLESSPNSDSATNERTNTFGRSEIAPNFRINKNLFIDGVAVFEPVQTNTTGDDTFFDDEGLFMEEIKLNFETEKFALFTGKFNPGFGTAWDYGRGIWSEDFAEDYEVTEKLGLGGSYNFGTEAYGKHTFTASTFFKDTSFLSKSTITDRGHVKKSTGGVSNTEDFSSFALSLDGENVAGVENLSYHMGFRHLAKGDADRAGTQDDDGFAIGVNYTVPVHEKIKSDVLLEYVRINNVDGGASDKNYYTASVVNKICDNWNITIGYTKRDERTPGSADVNDHLFQLSGGYDFGNGLTLELGWKNTEEANISTDIIGGLARYTIEF